MLADIVAKVLHELFLYVSSKVYNAMFVTRN
jgi:hypothetical protein